MEILGNEIAFDDLRTLEINQVFWVWLVLLSVSLLLMLMYFGDLKKEELSFNYFGDIILFVVRPDLNAFQAPTVGDDTPWRLYLFALSLSP